MIPNGQFLQNFKFVSSDALKDLRNENVIIVADGNNREIGKIINDTSIILLENDVGKENVQILPKSEKSNNASRVKIEVKEEVPENGLSNHDYDEIERKLEEMYSGNETDSSNNVKYDNKMNCQSIETASTFSFDDLENNDSMNENSNHEPEAEVTIIRAGTKRKRRNRTESLDDDSTMKASQIANEIDDTQMSENISDIIQNLEIEKPAEFSNVQTKSITLLPVKTVQNSQSNKSNKPIIKNDIQLEFRSEIINRPLQIKKNNTVNTSNLKTPNDLLAKLDIQGEVIEHLSNQLIMYNDMDRQMKSLKQELQNKNKQIELLNRRIATKKPPVERKSSKNDSLNLSDTSEAELKSRIDSLEDKNKKLMKTVTLDAQNRRKLECQVKSRDNQIKELNWKLDKASKFLDRAEKNANNYRKKMLSMQALVRRKKLSHEKTSLFDEFLIGQTDQSYSENALRMALEIEKVCGQEGYRKLLEYEFPLPNLNDLHDSTNGSVQELDGDENVVLDNRDSENDDRISIADVKVEKKEILENIELNDGEKENSEDVEYIEYLDLESLNETNETVGGTVWQDILNDNSEVGDVDEIAKHIMINSFDET